MSLRKIVLLLAAGVQHRSSNDCRIRSCKELYSRRRNLLCAYGAPACMGWLDAPWRKPKIKRVKGGQ